MAESQPTCIENEEWRDIPGYEGSYQVSDHGRVRSVGRIIPTKRGSRKYRGKVLSPSQDRWGYLAVICSWNGVEKTTRVASAVMAAFVGPRPKRMEIRHMDGNPKNNHLSNLRYGTSSENTQDTIRHGNHAQLNKANCKRGHSLRLPNLVPSAAKKGHRICLACSRASGWVYRHPEQKDDLQKLADSYFSKIMKEVEYGEQLETSHPYPKRVERT